MSGGRLIAGVGVGWSEAEFAALGVPFHERGARTKPRTSRAHAIAEARRRAANDSGWQRSRTERFADSPHQLHFSKASTAASGPASERESGAGMLPDLPRFSLGLHQGQHPSS
jgi:alkanesulfonate monooxygenase SsuD/methylene tetrahydromethanopterin reductase-like flavin-dependent oxidoreductase (luciferase family)